MSVIPVSLWGRGGVQPNGQRHGEVTEQWEEGTGTEAVPIPAHMAWCARLQSHVDTGAHTDKKPNQIQTTLVTKALSSLQPGQTLSFIQSSYFSLPGQPGSQVIFNSITTVRIPYSGG